MATAALLVVLTSLVTAVPRYHAAAQLPAFPGRRPASGLRAGRHPHRGAEPLRPSDSSRHQSLPAQFLVEVVAADGQVSMAGGPLGSADGPRLSAAQLSDVGTPFTAAVGRYVGRLLAGAGGARLQRRSSGHRQQSRRPRQHGHPPGDCRRAGRRRSPSSLLAGIGLPLVRASLAPLREIESTAAAIAGGDLSRRIDHAVGEHRGWAAGRRAGHDARPASRPPTWRERTARPAPCNPGPDAAFRRRCQP